VQRSRHVAIRRPQQRRNHQLHELWIFSPLLFHRSQAKLIPSLANLRFELHRGGERIRVRGFHRAASQSFLRIVFREGEIWSKLPRQNWNVKRSRRVPPVRGLQRFSYHLFILSLSLFQVRLRLLIRGAVVVFASFRENLCKDLLPNGKRSTHTHTHYLIYKERQQQKKKWRRMNNAQRRRSRRSRRSRRRVFSSSFSSASFCAEQRRLSCL